MNTVFISGGGKRLGRGLALGFAGKKFNVIVHYNESETGALETVELCRAKGVKSVAVKADLKNLNETMRAFDKAVNAVAVPNVLINNAGIFPARASLEELTPELWNATFDLNLRAAYYLSKIFSDKAESGSSIVNIASLGAEKIWDRRIAYNVSKSALVQLTKAMARDLAPRIRVNSVSPGSILIHEKDAARLSDIRTDKIPMQRQGRVSDIFETVLFLTKATYINGVNIPVDGGLHLI